MTLPNQVHTKSS